MKIKIEKGDHHGLYSLTLSTDPPMVRSDFLPENEVHHDSNCIKNMRNTGKHWSINQLVPWYLQNCKKTQDITRAINQNWQSPSLSKNRNGGGQQNVNAPYGSNIVTFPIPFFIMNILWKNRSEQNKIARALNIKKWDWAWPKGSMAWKLLRSPFHFLLHIFSEYFSSNGPKLIDLKIVLGVDKMGC